MRESRESRRPKANQKKEKKNPSQTRIEYIKTFYRHWISLHRKMYVYRANSEYTLCAIVEDGNRYGVVDDETKLVFFFLVYIPAVIDERNVCDAVNTLRPRWNHKHPMNRSANVSEWEGETEKRNVYTPVPVDIESNADFKSQIFLSFRWRCFVRQNEIENIHDLLFTIVVLGIRHLAHNGWEMRAHLPL